ncbi:hypothetical protein R1sor_001414 [Riccia sorocarpa]|uniref:Uncharacterized protein n=1 Tax=Riccia sorocarpa TaxID=122646 RepID=A0ABD3GYZ8_9MARC
MASFSVLQAPVCTSCAAFQGLTSAKKIGGSAKPGKSALSLKQVVKENVGRGKSGVVCAVGDVSADGTTYLIAGAVAVALVGTAFPLFFSRKDLCPVCDGAGFVRDTSGGALRANAARKDQVQIVCKNCNGLGKVGQTDKAATQPSKKAGKR